MLGKGPGTNSKSLIREKREWSGKEGGVRKEGGKIKLIHFSFDRRQVIGSRERGYLKNFGNKDLFWFCAKSGKESFFLQKEGCFLIENFSETKTFLLLFIL